MQTLAGYSITFNIFLYFVTLWPWPLTFWPQMISLVGYPKAIPHTKFEHFGSFVFELLCGLTDRHTDRQTLLNALVTRSLPVWVSSLYIISNGAIWYAIYHFLLAFHIVTVLVFYSVRYVLALLGIIHKLQNVVWRKLLGIDRNVWNNWNDLKGRLIRCHQWRCYLLVCYSSIITTTLHQNGPV